MKKQPMIALRKKGEEGFTLLEYAAGAAVLLGAAFLAMTTMSGSLQTYFGNVSTWITNNANQLPDNGGDNG